MVSYLIKSIICSGLLFAVYHFFLEREKMLLFNRFYLLGAMVFSLLAPLTTIEIPSAAIHEVVTASRVAPNVEGLVSVDDHVQTETAAKENVPDYLPWLIYGLIATALLLRTGFQVLAILRSSPGRRTVPFETAKLVLMPGQYTYLQLFQFHFHTTESI